MTAHTHTAKPKAAPAMPDVAEEAPRDAKWSNAWEALFGLRQVQVFFPDMELTARVYTLDDESGYRVQHKMVGAHHENADNPSILDDTEKLNYPNKARQGENHGRARLKREDILNIRAWADALIAAGQTPSWTIRAAELGVSEGALRDIVKRRTWTHI
jgi:hypothetical protein